MKKVPTPTTVTVQLPSKWMAEYFADWVEDAFAEQLLANEGQHIKEINQGGVEPVLNLVFVRADVIHEPPACEYCGMVHEPHQNSLCVH